MTSRVLTERNDPRPGPVPSKVASAGRVALLCVVSLIVMLPWPLLGILLMRSLFDRATEGFLFFGGITMFPLVILAIFGPVPEEVNIALLMLVWLATAAVPAIWLRRRLRSWWAVGGLLGAQAMLSLAQASMGALLIIGKSI